MIQKLNFENVKFVSGEAKVVNKESSLFGRISSELIKELNFSDDQEYYVVYGITSKVNFNSEGWPRWDMNDIYPYFKFYGKLRKLVSHNKARYFLIDRNFKNYNKLSTEDKLTFGIMSISEFKKLHSIEKEKQPEDTTIQEDSSGLEDKTKHPTKKGGGFNE